jgi:hypothetical protein
MISLDFGQVFGWKLGIRDGNMSKMGFATKFSPTRLFFRIFEPFSGATVQKTYSSTAFGDV